MTMSSPRTLIDPVHDAIAAGILAKFNGMIGRTIGREATPTCRD